MSGGAASKAKGAEFERKVCAALSLWITDGKRKDCFWRSAMSGGRATVHAKRGKDVRQAGDITAVAPEGHVLTNHIYIECKHYSDLQFDAFVLKGKGVLNTFWRKTCKEAQKRGKAPWLIAKQNMWPTLVIAPQVRAPWALAHPCCNVYFHDGYDTCSVWLFDDLLKLKPPTENAPWLKKPANLTSALTSTAAGTVTRTAGRVRL